MDIGTWLSLLKKNSLAEEDDSDDLLGSACGRLQHVYRGGGGPQIVLALLVVICISQIT